MISYVRIFFITTLISLGLTGCGDTKAFEQERSVEWFMEHDEEATKTLQQCFEKLRQEKENFKPTPNCINAEKAKQKQTSGGLREITNW